MKLCIYCQKNEATTVDHVPPKAMFPKPRPANLITVPCCDPCNKSFKNDDEYFLIMSLEWTAAETSDGSQIAAGRRRAGPPCESSWRSKLGDAVTTRNRATVMPSPRIQSACVVSGGV
jgi:hypothetical protein